MPHGILRVLRARCAPPCPDAKPDSARRMFPKAFVRRLPYGTYAQARVVEIAEAALRSRFGPQVDPAGAKSD